MNRFDQLRIPKDNPYRWEVFVETADGIPKSEDAYRTKAEAKQWAKRYKIGATIRIVRLARGDDGSGA